MTVVAGAWKVVAVVAGVWKVVAVVAGAWKVVADVAGVWKVVTDVAGARKVVAVVARGDEPRGSVTSVTGWGQAVGRGRDGGGQAAFMFSV